MADPHENASENDNPVAGDGDGEISAEERWRPYDTPKIRHITGIRIHQLTLPESLSFASKLIPSEEDDGYTLSPIGESSRRRLSNASTISYPLPRKSLDLDQRERSSSTSTARPSPIYEPTSPTVSIHHGIPRTRVTRPRAPTLAGEVIEYGHATGSLLHTSESRDGDLDNVHKERRPLRCFIALKLPRKNSRREDDDIESVDREDEIRRRTRSDERDLRSGNNGNINNLKKVSSRTTSSTTTGSLPNTPIKPSLKHTISSSSSNSSISYNEPRSRTISLTTPKKINNNNDSIGNGRPSSSLGHSLGRSTSRLSDSSSIHSVLKSPPPSMRGPNLISKSKASLGVSHQFAHSTNQSQFSPTQSTFINDDNHKGEEGDQSRDQSGIIKETVDDAQQNFRLSSMKKLKIKKQKIDIEVPFYISPIHHSSTNPRFMGLEPHDFANWLTSSEFSNSQFELEIWVELPSSFSPGKKKPGRWKKLNNIGGIIDLNNLRKGISTQINGIEFTLSNDPKEIYHLPSKYELDQKPEAGVGGGGKGVVERSLRETRMKKGIGIGGLHQLINLQAVIADTERSIEQVRRKVDRLLLHDSDRRCIRREVSERQARVEWFQSKISEVEKLTRETQARTTLKQQDIDKRRDNLEGAEEADDLRRGRGRDLEDEIEKIENERLSLLPQIHHLRSSHIQTLDSLFPILPLNPSQLLYTILDVPLPIPIGPKDPAPPLVLSEYKVDEKTTAAALGYVALIVQILGNLSGGIGGLPYIITCAGSRSTVRDGTGVMQGPRSFPLYAKGVERFRYEYAVFLLNKNIEMLMQESSIRLLDLRHTLPNLKNLLLTLSSPHLPSSHSDSQSRNISRITSRNVSYRSTTPTLLGSGGWGSRSSSTAWGNGQNYNRNSTSPGSSTYNENNQNQTQNPNRSPLKINTLLNPSPLGKAKTDHNKRINAYGDIRRNRDRTSDSGDASDEGVYRNDLEVESSFEGSSVA